MSAGALIGRLWREYVARYKLDLVAIAPMLALVAAAGVAYAKIVQWALDSVNTGDYAAAALAPVAVIAATLVRAIAMFAQAVLSQNLALKMLRDVQARMFDALTRADFARFAREETGRLVSRFTNDITVVSEGLVRGMQAMLRDALMLAGAIGFMLWVDWMLTLLVAAFYVLAAGPLSHIAKRARAQTEMAQTQLGALTAFLSESLSAIRFIKTYGLEARENARALGAFEDRRKIALKMVRNRARAEPLMEIIGGLAFAGVLSAAAWRISQGAMSIGDLGGIITAVGVAAPAARSLGNFNTVLNEAVAALARIFGVIDEAPSVTEAADAKPLGLQGGRVSFENVSFAYADAPALREVSFDIAPGETVAIVGPSGAGKSTLFNLLPRLYDPGSGVVRIDGQDTRALTLDSLRAALALVAQEPILFNDSVRANIALGRAGASEADIIEAAKAASAHGFISALPQGYDTIVGERGGTLSGGERQRLALARAFLRDAPILLLDEATSALDAASEADVQAASSTPGMIAIRSARRSGRACRTGDRSRPKGAAERSR
jgi:subfamily B ATP-binding cassette protein MsbA